MRVCPNCAKLGQIIEEVKFDEPVEEDYSYQKVSSARSSAYKSTMTSVIVGDYGRRVKNAREQKSLKQKDLASKLAIKESLLHNIESGHFEPSMELAQKLQKFLHINLIEQIGDKPVSTQQFDSGPMTLGDMIKIKKKK